MEIIKVLHNNTCSKSRAVLEYLDENDVKFEIIDIIANPLSETELTTVLKKLGLKPSDILRKNEPEFLEKYAGKSKSEDEIFSLLLENPEFIQRPILVKKSVAMVGRPIENIKYFIEK